MKTSSDLVWTDLARTAANPGVQSIGLDVDLEAPAFELSLGHRCQVAGMTLSGPASKRPRAVVAPSFRISSLGRVLLRMSFYPSRFPEACREELRLAHFGSISIADRGLR